MGSKLIGSVQTAGAARREVTDGGDAGELKTSATHPSIPEARHSPAPRATRSRTPVGAGTEALGRAIGDVATVRTNVAVPSLNIDPSALVGALRDGDVKVGVGLEGGVRIGRFLSVEPDTQAVATLSVRNGSLVNERTGIRLQGSNGEQRSLDGPFWLDPEKLYIDNNGQIRADVPCFPDPNLTEQILGKGVERVPEDMGNLFKTLQGRGAIPGALGVSGPPRKTDGTEAPPPPASTSTSENSAVADLRRALRLDRLSVDASGTLRGGPIRFGDGTVLNLADGAQIHVRGNLDRLEATIEADVNSMQVAAGANQLRGGRGRVRLHVVTQYPQDANGRPDLDAPPSVSLQVEQLDLASVHLEADAGDGRRHILDVGRLRAGHDGAESLLNFRRNSAGEQAFDLDLRDVELSDARGRLRVLGSDSTTSVLHLGEGDGAGAGVDIRGSLRVGADGSTALSGQIEDFRARVEELSLIDSETFDLDLGQGTIQAPGTSTIEFISGADESRFVLDSSGGPWTFDGRLQDVFFGSPGDRLSPQEIAARTNSVRNAGERQGLQLTASQLNTLATRARSSTGRGLASQADIASYVARLRAAQPDTNTIGDDSLQSTLEDVIVASTPSIDLSSETSGRVQAQRLELNSGRPPVFEGVGVEVDVVLDSMSFPFGGGEQVSLDPGTRGTLTINDAQWKDGAASPSMTGQLSFDVGGQALLRALTVQGLEGAEVKVDANTGEALVVLDVELNENGTLTARGKGRAQPRINVRMDRGVLQNGAELASAALHRKPLAAPEIFDLAPIRAPRAAGPQAPLSVQPEDLFQTVESGALDVRIPLRDASVDGYIDPEGPLRVELPNIDADGGEARIQARFIEHDGRTVLDPSNSRVVLDSPITVDVDLPHILGAFEVRTIISGFDFVQQDDGTLQLQPDLEWQSPVRRDGSGWLEDKAATAVEALVNTTLNGTIREFVGARAMRSIFGSTSIPADRDSIVASIRSVGSMQPMELASPETRGETETGGGGETPPSVDGAPGVPAGAAAATSQPSSGADINLDRLVELVDLQSASVRVGGIDDEPNLTLNGSRLALGGEQFIDFAPGSELTISGSVGEGFVLRGQARIDGMALGNAGDEFNARMGAGRGQIEIRLTALGDGTFAHEIGISNFTADAVAINARVNGREIEVRNARVLAVDGEPNNFVLRSEEPGDLAQLTFDLPGLEGEMALRTEMSWRDSILDVRRAHFSGGLMLDEHGLSSRGPLVISNLDASLTNVREQTTKHSKMDLEQIDISGGGRLLLMPGGDFGLYSGMESSPPQRLRFLARARRIDLLTTGPNINFSTAPGATLEGDLTALHIGPLLGTRISVVDSRFRAGVAQGAVTVGPHGTPIEALNVSRGTVHVDVEQLSISIPADSDAPRDITTRAVFRLDGSIEQDLEARDIRQLAALGIEASGRGSAQGQFRLASAIAYENGNFNVETNAAIDVELLGALRAQGLDPGRYYPQALELLDGATRQ